MRHAERDFYDYLSTKLPKMMVLRDGTPVYEIEPLSWEQRARLAEDKIQALVDGLMSDEAWERMMLYNPLAIAIATTAIRRHSISENDE